MTHTSVLAAPRSVGACVHTAHFQSLPFPVTRHLNTRAPPQAIRDVGVLDGALCVTSAPAPRFHTLTQGVQDDTQG
jgi:hypothetical protein